MPTLEVTCNGKTQQVSLTGKITVGRQVGNEIVIDDKKASRKHCEFSLREGLVVLRDLGSHNGTYIGPNKVSEAILAYGDTVRIGDATLRLLPDVTTADADAAPVAEVVLDDDDASAREAHPAVAQLAAKIIGTGPLTRQLAPLMQACVSCPVPPGAPQSITDIRLLDRQSKTLSIDTNKGGKPAEALQAFRQLLFAAFRSRATDIHVEAKPEVYMLRFRIDGVMHTVGEVSSKMGAVLLNVVKILCQVDIAKRLVVQEGSFAVELANRRVDFRMSMTPSTHGQKLALRILDKATIPDRFDALGMEPTAIGEVRRL